MHAMQVHAVRSSAITIGAVAFALAACSGADDPQAAPAATAAAATTTSPGTTLPAIAGTPLVVDTDLAADDIVALSYLTSHPKVDLLALSVSGTGEIRCPRGADVARGLLAAMDLGDVPVACGRSAPLAGDHEFPEAWRDSADNAYGLLLEMITPPADQPDAVTLLADVIDGAAAPVTLLTLGPLTNVAELLRNRSDLAPKISDVVVMGGAVDVAGNVWPDGAQEPLAAEWNLYVDPAAAASVLASGAPVTLVSLDATNSVPVTEDVIARLVANDTTPATERVRQLFELYPPEYLWDPLAAIVAVEPSLMSVHAVELEVVTSGPDAGRTVASSAGTRVEVADPPDASGVLEHLLRILAGVSEGDELTAPTTLPLAGSFTVGFEPGSCRYDGPEQVAAGRYVVDLAPGSTPFWVGVAHLTDGSTVDDALAWIAEHPDQEPPMVEELVTVGEGMLEPPADVVLREGNAAVVCFTATNEVIVGASLAVTS
jgi:inosine-uridine nucleoside N-ribohydrolase